MPIVLNGTSGDISGSSLTGIDTGKVLQILQAVKTDTASTASTSFGAISGFSQAITTTGSNKVLVRANIKIGTPGGNCLLLRLARTTSGSTSYISIGDASSNRIQASMGGFKSTQPWQIPADSCEFLGCFAALANPFTSPPAQKALSPSPLKIINLIFLFLLIFFKHSSMLIIIS